MEPVTILEVEKGLHEIPFETALFGMGCFWGPEARFGGIPGVLRTRVGYAGGTTQNPTYRKMGDHTETLEVDFDPTLVSYEKLLSVFWNNHYPNRDAYKGRQYLSILRYRSEEQRLDIERVKKEMEAVLGEGIETEIAPFESFTLAETRHQKYYLKRYPKALEQVEVLYPIPEMLVDSAFAARLNAFVKGFGTRQELITEITRWPITSDAQHVLADTLQTMKW
ncbi:peptide-methionine (S)-S-oxide reductase MsrA [Sporosarcina sp. D27]|uniref:peptide-methionine (S)-S-oxide reductase MsrA n=1 Tax=Sporosarcina sp. D27 TaxID=1382305 RepID=UPI00046FD1BD|nr:peptide-methionine (S)-S-oxide reductase MsrA [Sporosarcina sp. D27]